jgi:hypothetical protein
MPDLITSSIEVQLESSLLIWLSTRVNTYVFHYVSIDNVTDYFSMKWSNISLVSSLEIKSTNRLSRLDKTTNLYWDNLIHLIYSLFSHIDTDQSTINNITHRSIFCTCQLLLLIVNWKTNIFSISERLISIICWIRSKQMRYVWQWETDKTSR